MGIDILIPYIDVFDHLHQITEHLKMFWLFEILRLRCDWSGIDLWNVMQDGQLMFRSMALC